MKSEATVAVQIQEKLPTKKKGWRRFLSFFTLGKSKSKKVSSKIDQNVKAPKPVTSSSSKAKICAVNSECDVLLNYEAPRTVNVLPVVPEKRKRLSLMWMFKKEDAEKSKNKFLTIKTCAEVHDESTELSQNVELLDVVATVVDGDNTNEVEQLDLENVKNAEVESPSNINSEAFKFHVGKNLIVALSACPTIGEIIENNLQCRESSHLNFIPSKTNLSSKAIVEDVVDDVTVEILIQKEKVMEDPVIKSNDKSVVDDNSADKILKEDRDAIECYIDELIQATCEVGKKELESEFSNPEKIYITINPQVIDKQVTDQEVKCNHLKMSSQTINTHETKLISTQSELKIKDFPVPSRVKSKKVEVPKIMKNGRKFTHPYRRRIKFAKCNMPTIAEQSEDDETTDGSSIMLHTEVNKSNSNLDIAQNSKSSDHLIQNKDESVANEESASQVSKEEYGAHDCQDVKTLQSEINQVACKISEDLELKSSKNEEENKLTNPQEFQCYDPKISSKSSICLNSIEVVPITSCGKILGKDSKIFNHGDSKILETSCKTFESAIEIPKIVKTQRKSSSPYMSRIRDISFNMPTIYEEPENNQTTDEDFKLHDILMPDRNMYQNRPKTALSRSQKTQGISAFDRNKIELKSEDEIMTVQPDFTTTLDDDKNESKLMLIGDNPIVGQDSCKLSN
ncbi:hypothetical protein ACKWTF_008736 [Chironomus riparius]